MGPVPADVARGRSGRGRCTGGSGNFSASDIAAPDIAGSGISASGIVASGIVAVGSTDERGAAVKDPRKGHSEPIPSGPVSPADIAAKLRGIGGELSQRTEAARGSIVVVGGGAVIALVGMSYLAGRRRGRRRSTVVEIRRA